MAKKATAKKSKSSGKFSFLNIVFEGIATHTQDAKTGKTLKVKRTDVKKVLEDAFTKGAMAAAGGERVRFPVIGALLRKDVVARKSGKGVNPFTGEPMMIKARPASKKPRWSFPKSLKETFANKRYW